MRHVPAVLLAVAAASLLGPPAWCATAAAPGASLPAKPALSLPNGTGATAAEDAKEKPKRPEMPPSVRWQAKVLTPVVLPCEPVILDITWGNTSTSSLEYPDDQPLLFTVRKAGEAAPRRLWIVRRIHRDLMIPLGPDETYTRKVPFVLGWPPSKTRPPMEFVLAEPGNYQISLRGDAAPAPLAVTVVAPRSAEDVAAGNLWTIETAQWLVGTRPDPETVVPALERIYSQYPTSRYAAWALWIHATIMTAGGGVDRFTEAARCGEALVARHPDFPLCEEALKALVGVYAALGKTGQARETLAELAGRFPQSRHLARLRRQFGQAMSGPGVRSELPPAGTTIPRATIRTSGTKMIPEGVREAFETFWQAVAEGDFAAVEGALARDFVGDRGSRLHYAPALWRQRQNARSGTIQIRITKAEMAKTYARPRSMPSGAARTWHGPLCVVTGSLSVTWNRQVGGRTAVRSPSACWVFYEYPKGVWKLVSEVAATPNLLAAGQAQAIRAKLPRRLRNWRISDGRRERAPYEEIKAQLGLTGKILDEHTRWTNHVLTMTGPSKTEPRIAGRIRMLLKSSAGPAGQTVVRDVDFHLAVGPDGKLILKRIDVKTPTGRK